MYGETFYGRHMAQHQLQWSQIMVILVIITCTTICLILHKVSNDTSNLSIILFRYKYCIKKIWSIRSSTVVWLASEEMLDPL